MKSVTDIALHKTDNSALQDYISLLCKKVDREDSSLHAFLAETGRKKRLLQEAMDLQKENVNNLPLFGLTVGVKDIFFVDTLPTQAGSKLPLSAFHGEQADIVTKLKQKGALIVGKTVTAEFAFAEPNGTVNPLNHAYSPGGSSSGSAAAVAAGLCDLGIGSQTVGSTLRPASYCGIVGFKCSFGRINTDGMIYFAPSLDTVGLLTKDVSTMTKITNLVVKNWNSNKKINKKILLGVPVGNYLKQADKDILNVFEKTVEQLESNRYTIKHVPLFENISQINEDIWTLASYELAQVHKNWYPKYKQLYRPRTKKQIEIGLSIDKRTYQKMLEKQKELKELIEKTMIQNKIDLWICPATKTYPPKMSASTTGDPAMNIPWTFSGVPAISLPIKNTGSLPSGLQVVAKYGEDEILLSESAEIERIIN